MADIRKQTPSPLPSSHNHHSHNHDDIQGIDIIKATRKPTKMDHFRALVAHNFRVTLKDPTVYIFGSVIPIIMIGAAVGIVSKTSFCMFTYISILPGPFCSFLLFSLNSVSTTIKGPRHTGIHYPYITNPFHILISKYSPSVSRVVFQRSKLAPSIRKCSILYKYLIV